MLVIRLIRKGKKNQPFFRLVVTDKKNPPKSGRVVEDLGYKNPLTKKVSLNKERILYWISKGAKPSETVHNLLVSEKIIEDKKVHVSKLSTKKKAEIAKTAASAATAEPAQTPSGNETGESADSKPAEPEKPAEEQKTAEPAVAEGSGDIEEKKEEAKPEEPKQ